MDLTPINDPSAFETPANGIARLPASFNRSSPNPRRIGGYSISGLLGSGGMGQIFRADHERLERAVAIKMIHPSESHRPDYRRRLRREARLMARIDHPSVVQIYDFLELPEGEFIIMELVEGHSLRELTKGRVVEKLNEVLSIARQIAEGLEAAHTCGIVHRDLKSENIMLTFDGRVKLLDFGLSQEKGLLSHEPMTPDRPVMGTLRTMSPEQVKGMPLDERSDLFAFGVLIYELLTGESPFLSQEIGETLMRICTHRQRPVRYVQPDIPLELDHLLDQLLEKDPGSRPQDATQVVDVLRRLEAAGRQNNGQLRPSPCALPTVCEPTLPSIPSPRVSAD